MVRSKPSNSTKRNSGKAAPRSANPDIPGPARKRSAKSPTRPTAQNAKAVGGGLASGTTDFGPSTSSKSGGRTGFGTKTGRTTMSGPGGAGSMVSMGAGGAAGPGTGNEQGTYAAAGNSVLSTGRRTKGDSRSAIGSGSPRAATGAGNRRGDPASIPTAAGSTGVGTIGGGTAGTGAGSLRVRAGDVTDDAKTRRGEPRPNLLTPTNRRGKSAATGESSAPGRKGWKRVTDDARKGAAKERSK